MDEDEYSTKTTTTATTFPFLHDINELYYNIEDISRATAGKSVSIDFTVLSVAVITLSLLLVVELLRHRLDHIAHGRVFMQNVLDGVYHELSTLGIVEAAIFILHTYYKNLDIAKEEVFAKVHFMFFFTAIFNACMSAILAFVAFRVSDRLWDQTEHLDVDNYTAIRKEFDRIKTQVEDLHAASSADDMAEDTFSLKRMCGNFIGRIKYPLLMRQYSALLVQVRFHELRVHFIKANDLPKKFAVSDYLRRCQLDVFVHLVHISTFAWISLMAATNLSYFLMGLVAYRTEDPLTVGTSMSAIYIGFCFLFVIVSIMIYYKMKWIFSQIMHMHLWDDAGQEHNERQTVEGADIPNTNNNNPDTSTAGRIEGIETTRRGLVIDASGVKQHLLFWGGDPHYVIGAIQFMQFGYAIACAILLVFWKFVNVYYAVIGTVWFICVPVVSYFGFVYIMAQVIPRYTLCTSLGQLVKKRHLHETLAKFRLDEARKKRYNGSKPLVISSDFLSKADTDNEHATQHLSDRSVPRANVRKDTFDESDGDISDTVRSQNTARMEELFELVGKATSELPDVPSTATLKNQDANRRRKERKARIKSLSDGVASMRMFGGSSISNAAANELSGSVVASSRPVDDLGVVQNKTEKTRLRKTVSENVALMRSPPTDLFQGVAAATAAPPQSKGGGGGNKMKKSTSGPQLSTLIEDIPIRAMSPGELPSIISAGVTSVEMQLPNLVEQKKEIDKASAPNDNNNNNVGPPTKIRQEDVFGKNNDEATAGSEISIVDDEGSDFGDLPDVPISEIINVETVEEKETWLAKFYSFALTKRYAIMSGIFGTMPCFFLVAMRLESMLIESGTIKDTENTWHFNLKTSFWAECAYLSFFIVHSWVLALLFLFPPGHKDARQRRPDIVISALFDWILSSVCLGLLIWSEVERCCDKGDSYCCGRFGGRLYGGVGTIEPWTSVICLRIIRFAFGRRMWHLFELVRGNKEKKGRSMQNLSGSIEFSSGAWKFQDFDSRHELNHSLLESHHGPTSIQQEKGTTIELWETAIGLFPEIVEKYGPFSGELLQAMLGIEIIEGRASRQSLFINTSELEADPSRLLAMPLLSDPDHEEQVKSPENDTPTTMVANAPPLTPLSLGGKFSRLPVTTQSFIIAGKIGKPVRRSTSQSGDFFSDSVRTTSDDPNISTDALVESNASPVRRKSGGIKKTVAFSPNVEFELDSTQVAAEMILDDDPNDSGLFSFIDPNAPLIRSMRRCERRLPPLLKEWTVVDIVLTKYELVCFEAVDVQDNVLTEAKEEEESQGQMHTIRKAIIATKGGKGLRLRDVAFGRIVVGHIDMSEIDSVKVDRMLPTPHEEDHDHGKSAFDIEECDGADTPNLQAEYWTTHHDASSEPSWKLSAQGKSRQSRWEAVTEDRLKIHATKQPKQFLRFFNDLERGEMLAALEKRTKGDDIEQNMALHWCRTMARTITCEGGSDQLKQKLPHLGDKGQEEVSDFLHYVERGTSHESTTASAKKKHWNRGVLPSSKSRKVSKGNKITSLTTITEAAQKDEATISFGDGKKTID